MSSDIDRIRERWMAAEPCPNCNDTGDVHRMDGEWLGECNCPGTDVYNLIAAVDERDALLSVANVFRQNDGEWSVSDIEWALIRKIADRDKRITELESKLSREWRVAGMRCRTPGRDGWVSENSNVYESRDEVVEIKRVRGGRLQSRLVRLDRWEDEQ